MAEDKARPTGREFDPNARILTILFVICVLVDRYLNCCSLILWQPLRIIMVLSHHKINVLACLLVRFLAARKRAHMRRPLLRTRVQVITFPIFLQASAGYMRCSISAESTTCNYLCDCDVSCGSNAAQNLLYTQVNI